MRRLQILDLLRAVDAVAPEYHDVAVWWYLPPGSSQPRAETQTDSLTAEIVVEPVRGASPDLEGIRARLAGQLGGRRVMVRPHGGEAERFHLYRLLTRKA